MKQIFTAIIQQHEGINGAYIEPPFDVNEVFGAKRVKVLATFDGLEYRGSLVRMGGCYMLGITQEIRNIIGKTFGDSILVTMEKDEAERAIETPLDLCQAIDNNEVARTTFEKLSYTGKKDYVHWITESKRPETRVQRIEKAVILLSEGKKLK